MPVGNSTEVIAQLKDIHMPPGVSIWPLTIGWYILAAIIIVLCSVVGFLVHRWWQRYDCKRRVLKRLYIIKQAYDHDHDAKRLGELSILLRRLALQYYPRQDVAGLYGQAWLGFLDKTGQTTSFSQGAGKLLMSAPYQRHCDQEVKTLFHVVELWIKGMP